QLNVVVKTNDTIQPSLNVVVETNDTIQPRLNVVVETNDNVQPPQQKKPPQLRGHYHYLSVFVYSLLLSVAESSPSSSSISRTLYISYCGSCFPLWMSNA